MRYISLIFIATISTLSFAQSQWGFIINTNFTNHVTIDKSINNRMTWQWQNSYAPGIYLQTMQNKINQRFYLIANTKGFDNFKPEGHIIVPGSPPYFGTFQYKLRYLSFQHHLQIPIISHNIFAVRFFAGYELSYLRKDFVDVGFSNIGFPGLRSERELFPYNQYYDFNKFSMAALLGTGISLNKMIEVNFGFNHDFTNIINHSNFSAKNKYFTCQLLFNLNNILFNSKESFELKFKK